MSHNSFAQDHVERVFGRYWLGGLRTRNLKDISTNKPPDLCMYLDTCQAVINPFNKTIPNLVGPPEATKTGHCLGMACPRPAWLCPAALALAWRGTVARASLVRLGWPIPSWPAQSRHNLSNFAHRLGGHELNCRPSSRFSVR